MSQRKSKSKSGSSSPSGAGMAIDSLEAERKGAHLQNGSAVTTTEAASTAGGGAEEEVTPIKVDVANLSELKSTCDEAVERILTKPSGPLFKASHFHTDVRLVLGFTSAAIMVGTTLWSYFIEKDWQKNKGWTAVSVAAYIILSLIQTVYAYYVEGDVIFTGKRKMVSNRIETERLTVSSPSLPPPTKATPSSASTAAPTAKTAMVPPVYTLKFSYLRSSNGGKSILRRSREKVTLGHLGEWFTSDGEFVEEEFERRFLKGLEKVMGSS